MASEKHETELLTLSAWDEQRRIGVRVEDDGRAAFAYLYDEDEYLAAVWLYNHADAVFTEPASPDELPTPSPPHFILEPQIAPVTSEDDVQINVRGSSKDEYVALIYVRGRPHAALSAVEKIGWCVSARPGSPYAKPMRVEERPDGTFSVKLQER